MKKIIGYIIFMALFIVWCIIMMILPNKINEKKDWYIEITNEYINLRKEPTVYGSAFGKVNKGEKYRALEIKEDNSYYWYKIDYDKYNDYWVANPKNTEYLKDYNNPKDIVKPVIKYYEEKYITKSIDTINYDHLEIIENSDDYSISHEVFKSEDGLFWITYIVEDKAGNKTSKTQRIEFEIDPNIERVIK